MCRKQIDLITAFEELIAELDSAEKTLNDSLAAIDNKASTTEISAKTFDVKLQVRTEDAKIN